MRRFIILILISVLALGLTACAKKVVTQPVTQPDAKPVKDSAAQQPSDKDKPRPAAPGTEVVKVDTKDVTSPKYTEQSGVFGDIHFDFDKYDIRDDARPVLKAVSDWMLKNSDKKLLVEGHCDERGTNEYNLALGERRAKAAKDYLLSLGTPSGKMETLSYGEEKPLCTEQNEDCWQKNRRSHFVVLKEAK